MMESPPLAALSIWDDKTQRLRCVSVTAETADVRTFTFMPEWPGRFEYRPGQYITVVLGAAGGELRRTYTLSSSPSRPYSISLTAKMQRGSEGTRWMFDNVVPGTLLGAVGPHGSFTLKDRQRQKLLFIGAGSGVTPFISMTRYLADCYPGSDVCLISCSRSVQDILFETELALLQRSMNSLKTGFVVESGSDTRYPHVGNLDASTLACLAADYCQREVFCCGPSPFMTHVKKMLEQGGFDMRHYHEESFGATGLTPSMPAIPSIAPVVRFRQTGAAIAALPGETLLMTGRRAGVSMDSSCESGICGACLVTKRSGEVVMSHNGGIADEEIAAGMVLACCSRPLTDIELEA